MKLEDYFKGSMDAHGLLMSRSGTVTRTFVVRMDMSWKDDLGTLKEDFKWNNGENTQRVWTVKILDDGKYEGTVPDIVGVARGNSTEDGFHWKYLMKIATGNSSYKIRFDDRMHMINEKVILNEAVMYWFGIRVGKIIISFQKP